jgi:hypothetical protein
MDIPYPHLTQGTTPLVTNVVVSDIFVLIANGINAPDVNASNLDIFNLTVPLIALLPPLSRRLRRLRRHRQL